MSKREVKKSRKEKGSGAEVLSWQQKKELADAEEEAIGKEVEEVMKWTNLMEAMDEEQLKRYLLNRPEHLKSLRSGKGAPAKSMQRSRKPRCSSSKGLMASIWKFHREDEE